MNQMQIFNYNGSEITFEIGNGVMINATEMAKSFGKQPAEWFRLPSTARFMEALEAMGKSHRSELTKTINGVGTWMHEDVALEFARWLSPAFAIWCNDRIKELLKHGATALNPNDLLNPDFIIRLASELKKERQEKELLRVQSELQQKEIQQSAPKVEYYEDVLQSESLIPTNVIAKELGMSAISLNKILNRNGIIYRSGSTWVLFHKYQNKDYTGTKTVTYQDSQGNKQTAVHTYWTEKGREFIHKVVKVVGKTVTV